LDQQVQAMQAAQKAIRQPAKGWLRAVRDAVGLTRSAVSASLGVSRQSYTYLETAEANQVITLKSLQRAADAMGCDVVYFLVPRAAAGGTFTSIALTHDPALRHLRQTEHSMALEGQAVGDLPAQPPAS
jgi:predicted DNA-binding mobile mystery protein A